MRLVLYCSLFTIIILYSIIVGSREVIIKKDLNEKRRIVFLAMLNFIIYCLLQYSYGFVQWTIRLNKFHQYPHKNPFCIFVSICCIISLIIIGIDYIKHKKNEYGILKAICLLIAIHVLAILLRMIFSPFNICF